MSEWQRLRDGALRLAVLSSVLVLAATFGWMATELVVLAWPRLGWELLTELPRRSGREGGLTSILVATGGIVAVCLAVVVPLALGTAVLLASARGRWATALRISLDVLAGMPSIVLGLFGLLFFGDLLGLGTSLWTGGLSLACMVLPVVTRVAESALASVPASIRAAAAALALSRTTRLFRLELRVALPGLIAALGLGLGRALAETAVLLFTSGSSDRMPESLSDPGRALAVHIFEMAMQVAGGDASAAATAVLLLALLAAVQIPALSLTDRMARRHA